MQNFIPDRLAVDRLAASSEKKSAPAAKPPRKTMPPLARPACPGIP
jgi:hypothetical protein